jgi:hypothetical protein
VNRALRERTSELEEVKESNKRMKAHNIAVTNEFAAALRLVNGLEKERMELVRELEGLKVENQELKDEVEIF